MYSRRVLVIEDENSAREALESLLREEGFVVRGAASGQAGLECFREFDPDVVLCDYYLPDLDGLQVLRRIRASDPGSARFIMVTAGLNGPDERTLRAEADAYLAKPIDLDDLHEALSHSGRSPGLGQVLNAAPRKDIRHA
jgi:two-component system, OmpR family, response regulator